MAPTVFLTARDVLGGAAGSHDFPVLAIAGFATAGGILLLVGLWLLIRVVRKRAQRRREDKRGAAFLSVKGLVNEKGYTLEDVFAAGPPSRTPSRPSGAPSSPSAFSRTQINSGVVMPAKAALPASATREEILAFHADTHTVPRPFHFALAAGGSVSEPAALSAPEHTRTPSADRRSWRSSLFALGGPRSPVRASMASVSSFGSTLAGGTGGGRRKVRQLFAPVLPDELVLALGESLTVLHSYDDGWCIVGREASAFAAAAAAAQGSAFGQKAAEADASEVGAVPAWVFVKPTKGLRAERPMRANSLGVTVTPGGASPGARPDIMSWSNF